MPRWHDALRRGHVCLEKRDVNRYPSPRCNRTEARIDTMDTATSTTPSFPSRAPARASIGRAQPSAVWMMAVLLLAICASLVGLIGGPALGDHETLVALCARNMRLSGDWIVPRFMDIPWTRKPPLPYWMAAAVSYLLPGEPHTGLPVTPLAARLPSALAGLGTILLLWKLGALMFGARTGLIAAVLASSSILVLKYSPDATAEMPLTFCCAWAYVHFWCAVTTASTKRRIVHLAMFYLALGVGMMVKAPAPIAMVGLPLAVWWYLNRPLRILAARPLGAGRLVVAGIFRGLWPRTREAFTRLWLVPGLVLFAAVFVPWMIAAAGRAPQAVLEWKWQYFMRAKGDYLDSRDRAVWYYLPYVIGMVAPWVFLLPEAAVAPWLKRYRRQHRALLFLGLWALVAIGVMSVEPFKKPYYILPAVPPLIVMMAVVADRFYAMAVQPSRLLWKVWAAAMVIVAVSVAVGIWQVRAQFPAAASVLTVAVMGVGVLIAAVAALHIYGRSWVSMGVLAGGTVGFFHLVWLTVGPALDNVDRAQALAAALDRNGVPADANVLWADGRPDARLDYYFGRKSGYMIRPEEIVTDIQDRKADEFRLRMRALGRAQDLLAAAEPVYLIWERGNYDDACANGPLPGRIIASISRGEDPRKEWVVLTNRRE